MVREKRIEDEYEKIARVNRHARDRAKEKTEELRKRMGIEDKER